MMQVRARPAGAGDVAALVGLYRLLEAEMRDLSGLWPTADGLSEPVEDALAVLVAEADAVVVVGEIDSVVVGFLVAVVEPMLPQAGSERIGAIRWLFVDHPAREVGVGEAMLATALSTLRRAGLRIFDAHVLPGHRLVKNFFESAGFKARSIVMSRTDDA